MTASAPSTQPGGGEGAGGGQRGHRRKFPEVVGLFRRPARDPAGSPRRLCAGEVGVGVLRGEAPQDREQPLLRLLARPSPSRRAPGDWTWTEEEEERSGSPALPLPGGYRSGSEPRGTEPHQDYKTVRKRSPPKTRMATMWELLLWTLVALHRIRATGAQGMGGVTPTWGGGEGAGGGSPLGSRRPPGPRSWPGHSPLPGVSGSVPRVWGLFFGDGAVLLRLVASE